jgi:hypothetical protein
MDGIAKGPGREKVAAAIVAGEVVATTIAAIMVVVAVGDHPAIQMKNRHAALSPLMCVEPMANLAAGRSVDPSQRRWPKPM